MFGLKKRPEPQDPAQLIASLLDLSTKDSPSALGRRARLAGALMAQEKWEAAAAAYRQLADDQARVFGERHACTLASRQNLAVALSEQSRFDESTSLLTATIRDYSYVSGHDGEQTLHCRANLAMVLADSGKIAEAADLLTELVDITERTFGHRDHRTQGMRLRLGREVRLLARLGDAKRLAEAVLSHARRQSPAELLARVELALIASDQGEHQAGITALRALLTHPASRKTGDFRRPLAVVLTAAGEHAEAVALWMSILADCIRTMGTGRQATLCARHEFASALVGVGRVDEAEYEALSSLKGRGRPPVHICTLACRKVLARVAFVRGDRRTATAAYQDLVAGYAALLGENHPSTREARASLDEARS